MPKLATGRRRPAVLASPARRRPSPDLLTLGLVAVLLVALALRLWGIASGLPFAYNVDENAHFVPRAIGFAGHSLNPNYFDNPPALMYLLYGVFAVAFSGVLAPLGAGFKGGMGHAFALHPGDVWLVARVVVALLATLSVWLVARAGARLFDRRVGLLAAALLAVAFLPAFYAHLALNDAPTLAPIALSLWGSAGVLRSAQRRWYLVAGVGAGLAAATKYTGGIVVLALLVAALARTLEQWRAGAGAAQGAADGSRRSTPRALVRSLPLGQLALAGIAAVLTFAVLDPYALREWGQFTAGLRSESATAGGASKLGTTASSGWSFYLQTLTWGLGWVPALAIVAGALALARRARAELALLLVPALAFFVYMGSQQRFFGRWLLPIFPLLAILAAYGALATARWAAGRIDAWRAGGPAGGRWRAGGPAGGRWRAGPTAVAVLALLAQGIATTIHVDLVLARPDTRSAARSWLLAHVPAGARIVVEPIVTDTWLIDPGHDGGPQSEGRRWVVFSPFATALPGAAPVAVRARFAPPGGRPDDLFVIGAENYVRTLDPGLITAYARAGYCYVVSGSTQAGRALVTPAAAPAANAYYRELRARAQLVFHASPYRAGARAVRFDFDWSFDYYPLAYVRPGPEIWIYRLRGGACGGR